MKLRARKKQVDARRRPGCGARPLGPDERMWLDIAPVGREFGSPDYERLARLDAGAPKDRPL